MYCNIMEYYFKHKNGSQINQLKNVTQNRAE